MEPNSNNTDNIYAFHQGDGSMSPHKPFLFVFPHTESLDLDNMGLYVISVLGEKYRKRLDKGRKNHTSWYGFSTLQQGFNWYRSKKAVLSIYFGSNCSYLSFRPLTTNAACSRTSSKLINLKNKMNEMIKQYEALTATTPALEQGKLLASKNIHYYDERKALGRYTFDKRSPEGREFIEAKQVVKREKLLAQRGHNTNAKRREQRIGMSRLELQDN
ncbi:hypothetical protein IWW39_002442 [Coemansia spiralis]|uniref:Uncharacterized protein n=1 Tax=Coemansia spiralis TaxID=417178 RepID=A0A9W8GGU8_9FUNG|nr:hypothetical protein IWW39_002442 [Coemansia spiralis]